MIDVLEFAFQSFWNFIGFIFILGMLLMFFAYLWNIFWRHLTIRKHGYPPEHCDADGDIHYD